MRIKLEGFKPCFKWLLLKIFSWKKDPKSDEAHKAKF